jgi:hypothetical protein
MRFGERAIGGLMRAGGILDQARVGPLRLAQLTA